jgi:hypothetical protein
MKIVVTQAHTLTAPAAPDPATVTDADIVVGGDGRILKAREGHREAIAFIKALSRKVAK